MARRTLLRYWGTRSRSATALKVCMTCDGWDVQD